jgi:acetaldehyde dehydrogenase (acetylating)
VLELPTIDRFDLILPATMATTHQTPTEKTRDLQSLLINRTPLRLADTVRAESQDKKHENQLDQVKKMIIKQGKDRE